MRFTIMPLILSLCIVSGQSLGDGFFVRTKDDVNVYAPDQKAVIGWDDGRQVMILSTRLQAESLDDFGWIIPIRTRTKPEVELADGEIFFVLSHFFDPPRYGKGFGFGCAAAERIMPAEIDIVESKELDIYDVTVLKASDARQLYAWLNSNGFRLEKEAETILRYYTNEDFYFVTAKLDLRNVHSQHIDILRKFDVYEPAERLVAGETRRTSGHEPGRRSRESRNILKSALVQKEYEMRWREMMGSDEYDRLRARLAGAGEEQDLLAEAVDHVMDIMNELHRGLARPLRITFATRQAFFPLHISRINPGNVRVLVYLLSPERMTEKSGLLTLSNEKRIDGPLRGRLENMLDLQNARYAVKYTFQGTSEQFVDDVYFDCRKLNAAERLFEPVFLGW